MEVTTIEGMIHALPRQHNPHANSAERATAGVDLAHEPAAADMLHPPLKEEYQPIEVSILSGLGWNVNITA